MKSFFDIAPAEPKPEFWYGLPHGYFKLDLQPPAEGIRNVARQINELPEKFRDRAEQAFRLYAIVIRMLQKQLVQGCAFGMHPDGKGGTSLSVLTVSTLPTPEGNPKAALTRMLTADTGVGPENGVLPVELPTGTGFLMESKERAVSPSAPPGSQKEPLEGKVWQGTVAIPRMCPSSVVTVQLVTPSMKLVDDYRGVLLGVARTVTFTDPSTSAEANRSAGPFATPDTRAEKRSPFG